MASHTTSFLTRARSTRVPANTSKPIAPSTAPTQIATSLAGVTTSTTVPTATNPSNVSLFLTNLRLLELDLLPDWPDINAQTFTNRDAAQGQRKRIQCVEWALFRLFELWDPDEARERLAPYFPPQDQVQSLSLRSALLRLLEAAKKAGTLGRDAVVRKTMLDECRGERLEEVLAVFSSAVLRGLVAEDQARNDAEYPAIAQALALEERGYKGDTADISVLILAHRASLAGHLREKNAVRAQVEELEASLGSKERGMKKRMQEVKALGKALEKDTNKSVTEGGRDEVRRAVRNNWAGSERWAEALLAADAGGQNGGLLSQPFDRVWRRVNAGTVQELEGQSAGLLDQLDERIRIQRERLERWKAYRKELVGDKAKQGDVSPSKRKQSSGTGIDLGFASHDHLHLGRLSPRKKLASGKTLLGEEYTELIDGLQGELARIDGNSANPLKDILDLRPRGRRSPVRQHLEPGPAVEDPISELSELDDDLSAQQNLVDASQHRPDLASTDSLDSETKILVSQISKPTDKPTRLPQMDGPSTIAPSNIMRSKQNLQSTRPIPQPREPTPSPPVSPIRPSGRIPSTIDEDPPSAIAKPAIDLEPPPSPSPPASPTQALADQILASMATTSPSPTKKPRHTLSLAERTRLSMARGSHSTLSSDDEPETHLLPIRQAKKPAPIQPPPLDEDASDEHQDLIARTRKSMVGFEAARQKAQIERRRSQRKSRQQPSRRTEGSGWFGSVDEGTEGLEVEDSTLVLKELMEAEAEDAEAVFRSRPKMRTSPLPSPGRGWGGD